MHRFSYSMIIVFLFILAISLNAEYIVNDLSDLPDEDLTDGIYTPQTLRSAIQNANYEGVATAIKIVPDRSTIRISSDLPVINVPINFDGKGLILEPASGSISKFGLWITSNNSVVRNVLIQGFSEVGLVWQGSDGLIELTTCRNNGVNLNLNWAHRNTIGGAFSGYFSNYFYGGQGNGGYGIALTYNSDDNIIQFCSIGVDENGIARPNSRSGIYISEVYRTIIKYNMISGNDWAGIQIYGGNNASGTLIENNKIGINQLGSEAIPNKQGGIDIFGSSGDSIINNIISGNIGNGITISDPSCKNIIIENNKVGTDRNIKYPVPNDVGIRLNGSEHIIRNNIVSGNNFDGIYVSSPNSIIQSNIVGLDSEQKISIPNGATGIKVWASNIVIGDTIEKMSNVVAGNNGDGIKVIGAKEKNIFVSSNFVGTNSDTSLIFPNKGSGIKLTHSLSDVHIVNNTISSNGEHGVRIERNVVIFLDTTKPNLYQKPTNIYVNNNLITGQHGGSGVSVFNADSINIYGNIIEGVTENGISITNDSTRHIVIQKNHIGPAFGKPDEKKIGGDGIFVEDAIDVLIGSQLIPSDSNTIRFCKGYGVSVLKQAKEVYAFGNSMIENQKGGINLDDLELYFATGAHNDNLDLDTGSNGLQNTPDMEIAETVDDSLRIKGNFRGFANTIYRIDAYLAKKLTDDIQFKTQGSIYLDWFTVKNDEDGLATIDTSWTNEKITTYSTEFPFVTLTASGIEGTSCFSILGIPEYVDIETRIDTSRTFVDNNGNITLVASIKNIGTDNATTVAVRDTVSSFELKSVTISKGTALISDSTFVATIPSLGSGETVEYTAYGKAKIIGEYKRRIIAIPSENDINPLNNADTITLNVPFVNSIENEIYEKPEIILTGNSKAKITGHGGGNITVRLYNLLGQLYSEYKYTVLPEQAIEIDLNNRISIVEVLRDNQKIINRLICTW